MTSKLKPSQKQVKKAVDMLMAATRPVLLLGGGVIGADACQEFVAIAEHLQIPVVTSYMGKSGISYYHPLMAGHVGIQTNTPSGNQTFLESDVVLAVGVRFNDRHTGDLRVYTGNRKFIHIDSDPGQLGKILMLGNLAEVGTPRKRSWRFSVKFTVVVPPVRPIRGPRECPNCVRS